MGPGEVCLSMIPWRVLERIMLKKLSCLKARGLGSSRCPCSRPVAPDCPRDVRPPSYSPPEQVRSAKGRPAEKVPCSWRGRAGPIKGLWAGPPPRLLSLVSYLRGRHVLLGFGDHLWISVLPTGQQSYAVERRRVCSLGSYVAL